MLKTFTYHQSFPLESCEEVTGLFLGYSTFGQLNQNRDNVVWVFHGFSMDTRCDMWWDGIIGEGKIIDPQHYFIICVNMPGSCYGSINPLSVHPKTHQPYYKTFPLFTPLDMTRAFQLIAKHLGIQKCFLGLGPSIGGMNLLHWAIEEPHFFDYIIPMAIGAKSSAWAKAFNASQRMCIEADPTWNSHHPEAGENGMRAARAVALLSYRHYSGYETKQQDDDTSTLQSFKVESYQRYQGEKIAKRFNAHSYSAIMKTMDAYHLGRGKNSITKALESIKAKTMVMGIRQDVLFPFHEQEFLVQHIPNAKLWAIESDYGHDGFLLEHNRISEGIKNLLSL